jgi:protein TorT
LTGALKIAHLKGSRLSVPAISEDPSDRDSQDGQMAPVRTQNNGMCGKAGAEQPGNRMRITFSETVVACMVLLFVLLVGGARAQGIPINGYYGQYDAAQKTVGFPSKSLTGPRSETWIPARPRKDYHIGVLLPHLKDSYWIAADYGIVTRARQLGLHLTLYTAGAYINFGNQRAQLKHLVDVDKVDGIILASLDYQKMDPFVAMVTASGVPVVALINDIRAARITAKSMVSFYDMGYLAGQFVCQDAGGKNIKVAFFPGPIQSGWAPDTYQGFLGAVRDLKTDGQIVTVLDPLYGDTRPDVQRMRLATLDKAENQGIDYIVGNAVAAVEAVGYLRARQGLHPKAKIVATYITPTVYEQIRQGSIRAAPSDQTVSQCIIAVDMLVKILNGQKPGVDFPFRAAPHIPLITPQNIQRFSYEDLFGERAFVPVCDRYE